MYAFLVTLQNSEYLHFLLQRFSSIFRHRRRKLSSGSERIGFCGYLRLKPAVSVRTIRGRNSLRRKTSERCNRKDVGEQAAQPSKCVDQMIL